MVDLHEAITLGPFTVHLGTARLRRDNVEVELRPQAFRALRVLIQSPGRLVDFEQMIREAWDGVRVSRHTVAVTVGEIKHVLQEYGSWISCRSKFGYCLEIPRSEELLRMGRHFARQFTPSGFENALRCFEQVTQMDGADFRAFEGVSSTYLALGAFLARDPRSLYRGFLGAHERAVALRSLTPELRMDYAYALYIFRRDVVAAEAGLLEVQRERPASADLYVRLAMVYASLGRLDEALAFTKQAHAADELLAPLTFVETVIRLCRREYDLALQCGKKCLDLHPASQFGRVHYAEALEHAGRDAEALEQYRLAHAIAPDALWILARGARLMALTGRTAEAAQISDDLQKTRLTNFVDAYHMALLLDALGKRDEALAELERAYDENSYMLLLMDVDAKADALRTDPRFAAFRNKI